MRRFRATIVVMVSSEYYTNSLCVCL